MTPFDPRLPIIAADARVRPPHVYHLWMALREMGKKFHVAAFAQFTGLEERHVERILAALDAHDAMPDKRSATTRRGTRLPEDWTCPKEWIDWACAERGWPPYEVDKIAQGFADYWQAQGGQKACKLDWRKTWQTWVRNQHKPDGNYRPTDKRQTPEDWLSYCEGQLRRAKDADYRQGIQEWTEKVAEARARVADNVVPIRRA